MSETILCPYCNEILDSDDGATTVKTVNWALSQAGDIALSLLNIKGSFGGDGQVFAVPMICKKCGRRYNNEWGALSMKKEYSLRFLVERIRIAHEPRHYSSNVETTNELYRKRNEEMLSDVQRILNYNMSDTTKEEYLKTHSFDTCNFLLKEIGENKPLKELFRYNTKEKLFPVINKIIKSKGKKEELPSHINYRHKMKELGVTGFFSSMSFVSELNNYYGSIPSLPYPSDDMQLGGYISKVLSAL